MLFKQMAGTPQLMAELMYGSGLRLMELRRRHHLLEGAFQSAVRPGLGLRSPLDADGKE